MTSPSILALMSFTLSPAPRLDPPVLFTGYDLTPWQQAMIDGDLQYGTGFPSAVVRTYGTIARLWTPPSGSYSTHDLVAMLAVKDDPLARFEAWFRALPTEMHDYLASIVTIECDMLREDLDNLNDGGIPLATAWLLRRDALTIVETALTWVGRGEYTRTHLASIDADAATNSSTWRREAAEITASEQLRAVAWQEPESLVGAIVGMCYDVESLSAG